ncbi:MAG: glycosyltransferase family 39 protein [Candidatus Moraniibacteriota bacterium]
MRISLESIFYRVILPFMFLEGFLLRIGNLRKGFWIDEYLTIETAQKLTFFNHTDTVGLNPYYVGLRLVAYLFGTDETAVRIISVLFGLASAFILFLIGKKYFHERVGLISSCIFLLTPLGISLGQEVRPYSMLLFLSLCQLFFFLEILQSVSEGKRVKNIRFMHLSVLTLLILFIHLSSVLFLVSEMIVLSFITIIEKRWPTDVFKYYLACLFPMFAFFAWFYRDILTKLGFIVSDRNYITVYSNSGRSFADVIVFIQNISTGLIPEKPKESLLVFLLALILIGASIGICHSFIRRATIVNALFGITILRICIGLSMHDFIPRHAFILTPLFSLFLGISLYNLSKVRRVPKVVIFCVYGFFILSLAYLSLISQKAEKADPGRQWGSVADFVERNAGPEKAVIVAVPYLKGIFTHYYHGTTPIITMDDYKEKSRNTLIENNEIGVSFINQELTDALIGKSIGFREILVVKDVIALDLSDVDKRFDTALASRFIRIDTTCFPASAKILCVERYRRADQEPIR